MAAAREGCDRRGQSSTRSRLAVRCVEFPITRLQKPMDTANQPNLTRAAETTVVAGRPPKPLCNTPPQTNHKRAKHCHAAAFPLPPSRIPHESCTDPLTHFISVHNKRSDKGSDSSMDAILITGPAIAPSRGGSPSEVAVREASNAASFKPTSVLGTACGALTMTTSPRSQQPVSIREA